MTKKKEKWVEEFEELFEDCKLYGFPITTKSRFKLFISQQIKQAKLEILEKVKLKKKLNLDEITNAKPENLSPESLNNYWNMRGISYGYNQAIADLEALKEKLKN